MAPTKTRTRVSTWYKADDEAVHFTRKRNAPRP